MPSGACPATPCQPALGPSARTFSTWESASRRLLIQSSWWRPTSRTHQARASLRLRATPASMSVSSTARSPRRSRVITGTPRVVKCSSTSPQRAPQDTLRPKRRSASTATPMRRSRVSSRKRPIRAERAAWTAASLKPAGSSGSGTAPVMRISSRSPVIVGGPEKRSSGIRPANQPDSSSSLKEVCASCCSVIITCLHSNGRQSRERSAHPAGSLGRQRDVVLGEDLAHRSALGAHHQAVGLAPPVVVLHAAEDAAAADAGDRNAPLSAGPQPLHADRLLGVEAGAAHRHSLVLVTHPRTAVELAAEAAHRTGRDDRLLGAARADHHVD